MLNNKELLIIPYFHTCVTDAFMKKIKVVFTSTKTHMDFRSEESLICEREPLNFSDKIHSGYYERQYCCRQLLWILLLLLWRSGTINCIFTGGRYSAVGRTQINFC